MHYQTSAIDASTILRELQQTSNYLLYPALFLGLNHIWIPPHHLSNNALNPRENQKLSEKFQIKSCPNPFVTSSSNLFNKMKGILSNHRQTIIISTQKNKGRSFGYYAKIMAKRNGWDFSFSLYPPLPWNKGILSSW